VVTLISWGRSGQGLRPFAHAILWLNVSAFDVDGRGCECRRSWSSTMPIRPKNGGRQWTVGHLPKRHDMRSRRGAGGIALEVGFRSVRSTCCEKLGSPRPASDGLGARPRFSHFAHDERGASIRSGRRSLQGISRGPVGSAGHGRAQSVVCGDLRADGRMEGGVYTTAEARYRYVNAWAEPAVDDGVLEIFPGWLHKTVNVLDKISFRAAENEAYSRQISSRRTRSPLKPRSTSSWRNTA
jgi:hypothetical protein